MKKYQSIIWSLCLLLMAGLSFTACSDDDLSTDQYGNDIRLNSFGPCPVLRGGTLKFLGSNLDQIVQINLPGADPITTIDVKQSGKISEIWIEVPKEKCEEGIVTLITAKGGEIQSVTPVTYQEDIRLDEVYVGTEGNLSGNVGDVVTFKGDYLNLMHAVIFADNARVEEEDFIDHDRYTITVRIPKDAKTGRPQLGDGNEDGENTIYADDAISVGLPTASGVSPTLIKAGNTVTVTGTNLELIESVSLVGAEVAEEDITKSEDGTSLSFALPETATDGEVTLNTYSGVPISAGSIETVVPTNLSSEPSPVKNGDVITITGVDLDLVTGIAFENAGSGEIKSKTATVITAVVPEKAQTGNATLSLANGKTVTVAYTLVVPTVTLFSDGETVASEITITAGNALAIRGTDLDLVASISFPGDAVQTVPSSEFKAQAASAIALSVPAACSGTGATLNLKNGTSVDVTGLTIKPSTDPSVNEASVTGMISKTVTVEGKNFNNVQNVYIGETKVTKYASKSNTSMEFTVPATLAVGEYDLIMEDYEGNRNSVGKFVAKPLETDLWVGEVGPTDWSGSKTVEITDAMWAELAAGKTIGFDMECSSSADYWQVEIITSWWSDLTALTELNGGTRPILSVDPDNPKLEFTLLQSDLDLLKQQGNVFLFVGNGVLIKRIYVKD